MSFFCKRWRHGAATLAYPSQTFAAMAGASKGTSSHDTQTAHDPHGRLTTYIDSSRHSCPCVGATGSIWSEQI
jgi:hypothetical protein